ncbi:hypothetical protein [Microbispora sp. NPDC049125]|uniref:hypothetical protein n=1 Tax=Microbispora sp. NPDC049125 TaxID=3154929 RepID=UPI00346583A1
MHPRLYVNGVLAGAALHEASWGAAGAFAIGRGMLNGGRTGWWKGGVDEAEVLDHPASAEEIERISGSPASPPSPTPSPPVSSSPTPTSPAPSPRPACQYPEWRQAGYSTGARVSYKNKHWEAKQQIYPDNRNPPDSFPGWKSLGDCPMS